MEPRPKYSKATYVRYPIVFGAMFTAAAFAFFYRKRLLGDLSDEQHVKLFKNQDIEGMKILETHMKYAKP